MSMDADRQATSAPRLPARIAVKGKGLYRRWQFGTGANPRWQRYSRRLTRLLWAILFLALPVTSFPYFPSGLGGRTLVRPLAIYPLLLLVILVTLPRLLRRPLPRTFLPLLAFFVAAMISSVAALPADLEAYRGVSLIDRFARNGITLILGAAFYFTIALLPQSWEDLRFSLRWLYAGFGLALAWGSLQIPYVLVYYAPYFNLINSMQRFVSARKLFSTRISGLTYEPKWFAEQICFLLLPWLLGAVITRRSVFNWRYKFITVEAVMLVWAAGVLVFTFSRTGLAILGVLIILGYLTYRSTERPEAPRAGAAAAPAKEALRLASPRKQRPFLRRAIEVLLLLSVFTTALVVVGSQNPYFSRLWRYWTEARRRNKTYLEYIAFEQRFVYWQTAFQMFEDHPLFGVGLGNYAFYFDQTLPDRPWNNQVEIVRQITPGEGRDRLITPKNLFARLLAETGIIGAMLFLMYFLAVLGCILYLWLAPGKGGFQPEARFWGISGLFAVVVFMVVIFSFDSFALPNMWVVFGLLTAAAHLPEAARAVTHSEPAEPSGRHSHHGA
jgi:O-antigen ligase